MGKKIIYKNQLTVEDKQVKVGTVEGQRIEFICNNNNNIVTQLPTLQFPSYHCKSPMVRL